MGADATIEREAASPPGEDEGTPLARRALGGACLAHALHDGYTDLLYVLLPVWQTEFGLSYAALAVLRALYYGAMGVLQVPGERWTADLSGRSVLALSTLVAAAGYLLVAFPLGLPGLCAGLLLSGSGSSLQHPRASRLVAQAHGARARGPLGIYNFAGDIGKAAAPLLVALALAVMGWRSVSALVAGAGLAAAAALWALLPRSDPTGPVRRPTEGGGGAGGFGRLLTVGALDTGTRMGFLLFLPFLLRAKGGGEATVGTGLALVFLGGAFGKAACGWLGARFGVVASVVATETLTAGLIAAAPVLPLAGLLLLLPVLGTVLNGTSSVLYGTVPDLAPRRDVGRAFAVFYTATIGAGGFAPIAFGLLADRAGETAGVLAAAGTALAIVPLVLSLRPVLSEGPSGR